MLARDTKFSGLTQTSTTTYVLLRCLDLEWARNLKIRPAHTEILSHRMRWMLKQMTDELSGENQ